ncbi:MAG: beta-lactamase family protein [Turicibacter sp.]|nr:beta-lactamase family protein [Turicibacter sp.]
MNKKLMMAAMSFALLACGADTASVVIPETEEPRETPVVSMADLPEVYYALSRTIDGYLNLQEFNGVALVASSDSILLLEAYGMADVGQKIPLETDSKFQIASITKPFTAIAILQLAEEGLLALNQPISDFLPGVLNGEHITLHHLLTHSSGLFAGDSLADYSYFASSAELIEPAFGNFALHFWEPGSTTIYSNLGYHLLGVVIEQVSGLALEEFFQQRIFDVAQMEDSGLNMPGAPIEKMAIAYTGFAAGNDPAPVFHPSTGFAAGGIHSTAYDLFNFGQAIYGNALLNPESTQLMFTPNYNMGLTYYGYGWFLEPRGIRGGFTHPGVLAGWRTLFLGHQDNKVTVILLSNQDEGDLMTMGVTIAQLILE